jgi:ParB-like chromosome segregation protein Spo0J
LVAKAEDFPGSGTDGKIIAGEGRWRAAQTMGMRKVPVIKLEHLSPAQRQAVAIADNQLALNAGWDEQMLGAQLALLKDQNFDLQILGFDDMELARKLADSEAGGLSDEDEVAAVPIPAFVAHGYR